MYATSTVDDGLSFHVQFKLWRKMSTLPEQMLELMAEIARAAPSLNIDPAETNAMPPPPLLTRSRLRGRTS